MFRRRLSLDLSKDRTLIELIACPNCTKFQNHVHRFLCGPQIKGPRRKRSVWFLILVRSRHAFNLVGVLSVLDPDLIFLRSSAPPSSPPLLHSSEKGSGSLGTTKWKKSSCLPSELVLIEWSSKGRRDPFVSSCSKRARCAASWPMQFTYFALPAARAFATTSRTTKPRYPGWNTSCMSSTGHCQPD